MKASVSNIHADVQSSMHIATVTKLAYAEGASWNMERMCQAGTQEPVLDEIMTWIEDFQGNTLAQIYCLTAVSGAGKTAIAHSIAKQCADKGWLITAFFFSRDDSVRTPRLFSTIACDLASRFPSFRAFINQAIDKDPSLAGAGMTRQFTDLILAAAASLAQDRPLVLVLDALDEGYSKVLLELLAGGKGVCRLPGMFRIFVTCRDVLEAKQLFKAPHVYHRSFKHNEGIGLGVVKMVAEVFLKGIAQERELEGWPTKEVVAQVVERSEGLTIWVIALCRYLEQVSDPKDGLKDFLKKKLPAGLGAEEQMDQLYATILQMFPWKRDRNFPVAYKQIMGTILASKVPLSAQAIGLLHFGKFDVKRILPILKPLLLSSDQSQPVQILHQSLYDLLAERARDINQYHMFAINVKIHNQVLALSCIKVINKDLDENTPGTGYLYGTRNGIPKLSADAISEHLWYACRFWMEHLVMNGDQGPEVVEELEMFLTEKLQKWIEIVACMGQIQKLEPLIDWITVSR